MTCLDCDYGWARGGNGEHSCVKILRAEIAILRHNAEADLATIETGASMLAARNAEILRMKGEIAAPLTGRQRQEAARAIADRLDDLGPRHSFSEVQGRLVEDRRLQIDELRAVADAMEQLTESEFALFMENR